MKFVDEAYIDIAAGDGGNGGLGWQQSNPLHQDDVPRLMHCSLSHRVGELGAGLPGLRAAQGGSAGVWVEHGGGDVGDRFAAP